MSSNRSERLHCAVQDNMDHTTQMALNRRLYEAIDRDCIQDMKDAIADGADVHDRGIFGETPLTGVHSAGAAIVLLQAGADINARDGRGRTPLMSQCDGPEDVVQTFIKYGADLNAVSNDNDSVLSILGGCGNGRRAKMLMMAGAKTRAPSRWTWMLRIVEAVKSDNDNRLQVAFRNHPERAAAFMPELEARVAVCDPVFLDFFSGLGETLETAVTARRMRSQLSDIASAALPSRRPANVVL